MTQQSRIRIKYGAIEIEYEGPEQFLKDELPGLVEVISNLAHSPAPMDPPTTPVTAPSASPVSSASNTKLAPNSVAAKLGSKSGLDLIIAAAGYLEIMAGKASYSRQELLTAMKEATQYYNATISSNLSKYLKTLVKDSRLNEVASGRYALAAAQRAVIEEAIV